MNKVKKFQKAVLNTKAMSALGRSTSASGRVDTPEAVAEKIVEHSGSSSRIVFLPLPEDAPKRRRPDIAKARRVLGWEPQVPLDDGLAETIAYFRALPGSGVGLAQ